jgi:ubiquinone/menaquinone biosynthesis C-methylase UbiE
VTPDDSSKLVENCLAKPEIHRQWASVYRTADNEAFFEAAFDHIVRVLEPSTGARFLDVGCGSCTHSLRLARRGFDVLAIDVSESVLEMAREKVQASGMEDRIRLQRMNLCALTFSDASFACILCWGVLMHVPDVGRAISELARVLRPGGMLVVSEGNMHSLEAIGLRSLKLLLGREKAEVRRTPAGIEYWMIGSGDALLTRQANVRWLIKQFESEGLTLLSRTAGQFSESYTRVSAPLIKRLIHRFNNSWFKHVRLARPAYGNILLLKKRE